ncbi:MAG: type II secretion system F family protein [Simkaniaceae bacterium]|nr:type II secretion system F family protein [Simkaniaceae bacterium]
MTLYQFEAFYPDGKKQRGKIDAESFEAAKEKLLKQGVLLTKLIQFHPKGGELKLAPKMQLALTRDLAVLLRSSLPLYESLLAIKEKYKDLAAYPLLLELCDGVKKGEQLSKVLLRHPKSFDQVYIAMIKAGEETGQLEEIFQELALLTSRSQKVKGQMVSAMIYPAFLLSFCFLVISALLFFLVPSLAELYEGRTLHPMTAAVLSLSFFLTAHSGKIAICMGMVGVFICFIAKKTPFFRKLALKLPLIGRMTTEAVLLRFARVFGVLLTSGVPFLEALRLSKGVMHHVDFEEVIRQAEVNIIQGGKLTYVLGKSPLIPPLFSRMLSVAEEAGHMEGMLKNIVDIYEEDLEKSVQRLTALLQPVMLLVLGVIVGVVMLAVLLPLTDVSSMMN